MATICDKCNILIPMKRDVNKICLEPDVEMYSLNLGINVVTYELCSHCYREIFNDLKKKIDVESN